MTSDNADNQMSELQLAALHEAGRISRSTFLKGVLQPKGVIRGATLQNDGAAPQLTALSQWLYKVNSQIGRTKAGAAKEEDPAVPKLGLPPGRRKLDLS